MKTAHLLHLRVESANRFTTALASFVVLYILFDCWRNSWKIKRLKPHGRLLAILQLIASTYALLGNHIFKLCDMLLRNKLLEVSLMPFLCPLFSFSFLLFDRLSRIGISSEIGRRWFRRIVGVLFNKPFQFFDSFLELGVILLQLLDIYILVRHTPCVTGVGT